MLSLPDLKEKKIVLVPSFGKLENILKLRNNNIYLYREDKLVSKISCHIVIGLFIVGEFTLTSKLIRNLKEKGISIFFLNSSFQLYADLMSKAEGNYKLRKIQYNANKKAELENAKMIVVNKINNQYSLLKKLRRKPDKNFYQNIISQIENVKNHNSLLGLEGSFSSYYFKNLFKKYGWLRRAPRTKEDIPNFMLDIGYTFLFNYVDSLLNLFGFDTYKGFYHKLFFNRKSLSCDIVEPFRSIVDNQLIRSYGLKQIDEKDFKYKNGQFSFKKYENQKKYSYIWFDLIMKYKEQIYNYILDYYRYTLDPIKYSKPYFEIIC